MRLNASNVPANADTVLYDCPDGSRAIVTVSLCNRADTVIKVRLALTSNDAAPAAQDWIEYDVPLPAAGASGGSTLERTGLVMTAKDRLYVRASAAGVSAVAYGVQEAI